MKERLASRYALVIYVYIYICTKVKVFETAHANSRNIIEAFYFYCHTTKMLISSVRRLQMVDLLSLPC